VTGCCPARWLHANKKKILSIAACKQKKNSIDSCMQKGRKSDRLLPCSMAAYKKGKMTACN